MATASTSAEANLRLFDPDTFRIPARNSGFLGGGSFGKCYKCYEPAHRIVAVKVMQANLNSLSQSLKKRAIDEANIAMQANHENIVRLYGLINMEQSLGLVMEYMLCGTLLSLLENKEVELCWSFRLRVCLEIASGLAFLHGMVVDGRHIVHGDFKPENVLLDRDCHAKIADFGSSTMAFVTSTVRNVSQSSKAYTIAYCAPEVMDNPFYKVKPSSDVFSYGMTVYQVMFREYPISNGHISPDVYKAALERGKRPPLDDLEDLLQKARRLDQHFIGHLVGIMKECWETDPLKRPESSDVREKHMSVFSKAQDADVTKTVAIIKKSVGSTQHDDVSSWVSFTSVFGTAKKPPKNQGDNSRKQQQQVPQQPKQQPKPQEQRKQEKQSFNDSNSSDDSTDQQLQKLLLGLLLGDLLNVSVGSRESWEEFEKKLPSLEKHLLAGRKDSFQTEFKALEDFVKGSSKDNAGNIMYATAEDLIKKEKYYQAAIASALVSRAFMTNGDVSNKNLHMIECCAANIQIAVDKLKDGGNSINGLSKAFFPSVIESIISDLCKMNGDKQSRIVNLGWCCKYLSSVCDMLDMQEDSTKAMDRGIKFLDNNLGAQTSSNFRIYGLLHHFRARRAAELYDFAEARKLYIFAEKCFKNADDFRSTQDKQIMIGANTRAFEKVQHQELAYRLAKDDCSIM